MGPVDMLDSPTASLKGNKLNKPLTKVAAKPNSPKTDGLLDMGAQDIMDDLNLTLSTFSLSRAFKVKDVSLSIQITSAVVNRDCSHVDAKWHSEALEGVVQMLAVRPKPSPEDKLLVETVVHKVSKKLQDMEGRFRARMIRTMSFRRVPRVFFRASAPILTALKHLQQALDAEDADRRRRERHQH